MKILCKETGDLRLLFNSVLGCIIHGYAPLTNKKITALISKAILD